MNDNGLCVLNGRSKKDIPAQFTFSQSNGSSVIDLVWSTLNSFEFLFDFSVLSITTMSNHFPVIVECELNIENLHTKTVVNRFSLYGNFYFVKKNIWNFK